MVWLNCIDTNVNIYKYSEATTIDNHKNIFLQFIIHFFLVRNIVSIWKHNQTFLILGHIISALLAGKPIYNQNIQKFLMLLQIFSGSAPSSSFKNEKHGMYLYSQSFPMFTMILSHMWRIISPRQNTTFVP